MLCLRRRQLCRLLSRLLPPTHHYVNVVCAAQDVPLRAWFAPLRPVLQARLLRGVRGDGLLLLFPHGRWIVGGALLCRCGGCLILPRLCLWVSWVPVVRGDGAVDAQCACRVLRFGPWCQAIVKKRKVDVDSSVSQRVHGNMKIAQWPSKETKLQANGRHWTLDMNAATPALATGPRSEQPIATSPWIDILMLCIEHSFFPVHYAPISTKVVYSLIYSKCKVYMASDGQISRCDAPPGVRSLATRKLAHKLSAPAHALPQAV
jgi:hypothetical protein